MLGLLVAARYLTIVPLPGRAPVGLDALGRAAPWFPLVGFAIGAVLALVDGLAARLFPSLLAALLVVTAWKLLTGGIHLDGLADCLDGLVGHDPAHRLAIMRDSRIGTFGAVGLILMLFLEIAALAELPSAARWRALLLAPMIGRVAPPVLARLFAAARPDGHGAAFRRGLGPVAAPVAVVLAALASMVALGALGIVAVAAGLGAAVGMTAFVARRLGGITGDVLGASVETAELVVLLTVSAWVHARFT